jgi:hypothetical protein
MHGLVRPGEHGVVKYDDRHNDGHDRGNLAYRDLTGLANGFTRILTGYSLRHWGYRVRVV